jgi:hypothetical protein
MDPAGSDCFGARGWSPCRLASGLLGRHGRDDCYRLFSPGRRTRRTTSRGLCRCFAPAEVAAAQRAAIAKWSARRQQPYDYLKAIQQPTLVVNVAPSISPVVHPRRLGVPISRQSLDTMSVHTPSNSKANDHAQPLRKNRARHRRLPRHRPRQRAGTRRRAGAQVLVHFGRGANEADGVVGEIRKAGGRGARGARRRRDHPSLRSATKGAIHTLAKHFASLGAELP